MSMQKHKSGLLFSLFFCTLLAARMFFYFSPSHDRVLVTAYLWPAVIAAAALLFAMRGYKGMPKQIYASAALAVWFLAVNVINGDKYLEYNLRFVYGVFTAFGIGFPLIILIENKEKHLMRISLFYSVLMFGVALLCIYCWATGNSISSPFSDEKIQVTGWRMFFFSVYPNELGCALGIAFFCLLMLSFRCERPLAKAGCLLMSAVVYLAAIPCVSRTTAIVISLTLAGALILLLIKLPIPNSVVRIAAAIAVSGAVAMFSISVLLGNVIDLKQVYTSLTAAPVNAPSATAVPVEKPTPKPSENKDKPVEEAVNNPTKKPESKPVPTASPTAAPAPKPTEDLVDGMPPKDKVWARDMTIQVEGFTGRTAIWEEAIVYIRERPKTLLIGNTDGYVARIPTRIDGYGAIHMQNIWIEVLMQTGIPGLALYAYIMLSALWSAIRRFFNPREKTWKRYLCLIMPVVMLTGMMEIYPGVSGNIMDMVAMMLVGAVIAMDVQEKAEKSKVLHS